MFVSAEANLYASVLLNINIKWDNSLLVEMHLKCKLYEWKGSNDSEDYIFWYLKSKLTSIVNSGLNRNYVNTGKKAACWFQGIFFLDFSKL